jgi:probable HAF family extracellular repeat protein
MDLRHGVLGVVVLFGFVHEVTAAPQYIIEVLGIPARRATDVAINNTQDILVSVLPADQPSGLTLPGESYVLRNGTLLSLPTLGGFRTVISRINDAGTMVGWAELPSGEMRSARVIGGQIENLEIFGDRQSVAMGINSSGDIIGMHYPGAHRAFLRRANGETMDLGTLGGDVVSASDINDSGQIVGSARPAGDGTVFAFLYEGNSMTSLGTLGGGASYAHAINELGVIVGESNRADGIVHAFLYDPLSGMQDIGSGDFMSSASDINIHNVVVGTAEPQPGDLRAFVYDEVDGMRLLDDLIPSDSGWEKLMQAGAVNDFGHIVGLGRINGEVHAFLATPIPEPSCALMLLMAGLFAHCVKRCRPSAP